MSRKASHRGRIIPVLFFTFMAGGVAGWYLRGAPIPESASAAIDALTPTGTAGDIPLVSTPTDRPPRSGDVEQPRDLPRLDVPDDLARRNLRLPIDGASVAAMKGQFGESRDRGVRGHEAVDILAPRNTVIYAVDDGVIAKLFVSRQGGNTIYQFDPSGRFCYYYAHLERYAPGVHEGLAIRKGDELGYVGTSGNAPPNTPHLHFAIFELTPERKWWKGTAIDPFPIFAH
jgi:murein DD-endopeptidase MepM/ murein hydrolase activator NlpD